MLDEILVCNDSVLLEFIHDFDDLNIYKSLVVDDGKKDVPINGLWGDDRDAYLHLLGFG